MRLEPKSVFGAAFGTCAATSGLSAAGMALLERSDIGCVLVNCATDAKDVIAHIEEAAGMALPRTSGATTRGEHHAAIWLAPRAWLVQCPVDREAPLAASINAMFEDKRVHAALFTDHLCWLELRCMQALDLLADGGFISLEPGELPIGHAKRTLLAGMSVIVARAADARWLLGIERSRARYFLDWLHEAAIACGLK